MAAKKKWKPHHKSRYKKPGQQPNGIKTKQPKSPVVIRQATPEELEALRADGPKASYRPAWVHQADAKKKARHLGTTEPPP